MALASRIQRLERVPATAPDGGRRCRVCRDGTLRRSLTRFDGAPAPWHLGEEDGERCPGCGRETVEIAEVRGIDPARL